MAMTTAYLSLGSNKNKRRIKLQQAIEKIATLKDVFLVTSSSFYETSVVTPEGYTPIAQKNFINIALEVHTTLSCRSFFKNLQKIERTFGQKKEKNAPRDMDIDLITFGHEHREETDLILPHAPFFQRLFVLLPLLEIIEFLPLPYAILKNPAIAALKKHIFYQSQKPILPSFAMASKKKKNPQSSLEQGVFIPLEPLLKEGFFPQKEKDFFPLFLALKNFVSSFDNRNNEQVIQKQKTLFEK